MQTSFMHPPFGFALFFLRSVAPASVKTTDIYWGAIPFVCIQVDHGRHVDRFPAVGDLRPRQESEGRSLDTVEIDIPSSSDYGGGYGGYGYGAPPPSGLDTPETAPPPKVPGQRPPTRFMEMLKENRRTSNRRVRLIPDSLPAEFTFYSATEQVQGHAKAGKKTEATGLRFLVSPRERQVAPLRTADCRLLFQRLVFR
jgi:hypothetical protein